MAFIESQVDFLKNDDKLLIIHLAKGRVDFIESLVDFLKNKEKLFIIYPT